MRLLLVIPEDARSWVMAKIENTCVPFWRTHVEVFVPDRSWSAAETTNHIIERAETSRTQDVIVVKTVPHLRETLSNAEFFSYQSPGLSLLRWRLLDERLQSAGVLWKARAE